jgi:hypothetical protein
MILGWNPRGHQVSHSRVVLWASNRIRKGISHASRGASISEVLGPHLLH